MKLINSLSLLMIVSLFAMTSCKNEGEKKADDTRASVSTTAATTAKTNASTPVKPAAPVGPLTSVKFEKPEYEFGEVTEGDKVKHTYYFTNTGKEPMIISNAKGSCGCTVPTWPREPIAPGAKGKIDVVFNTARKGKVGGQLQSKRVTITANTDPANTYLTIKGKVNRTAEKEKKYQKEKADRAAKKAAATKYVLFRTKKH